MKEKDKAQGLMEEVKRLRGRVSELEIADAERKRAEVEVQRQEKRFQAIADNSSDVIILIDTKGTILYESPAIEQLLGLIPAERIGASIFERVHPDDILTVTKRFQLLLNDAKAPVQRIEIRLRHKDGSWRTVEAAGSAVAHNSIVEGLVINLRDITDRKMMEKELKKSEERFQSLIEASLDVTVVLDVQGNVIYLSPNFESVWGRKTDGILGRDMFKDIHPDDIPMIGSGFVRLLKNPKEPVQMQIRALRVDGTLRILDAVAHNRLENPAVRGIVVNFRDVTERRQAEEALRESKEKLRILFETVDVGITVTDMMGKIIDVNETILKLYGFSSREEVFGRNGLDFISEKDRDRAIKALANTGATGKGLTTELTLLRRDGSEYLGEVSTTVLHDISGNPVGVVVVQRDITERKRAEQALRESSVQWQATFDATSDAVCLLDIDQRIQRCNRAMAEMFNTTQNEIIGRQCWEVVHGTKEPVNGCPVTRIKNSLNREEMEMQRGERWYNVAADPILGENREIKGIVHVVRDITASKSAEEMIQRQERYFRSLIENSSDGIMVLNKDGTIRYESQSNLRLLGYTAEDRIGKSVFEPIHPDDIPVVARAFDKVVGGGIERAEVRARHSDGSWRFLEATASNLMDDPAVGGIVVNLRDITERKRAEEALKERDQLFKKLAYNVPGMIYQFLRRPDGTYCAPFSTDSIKDILGCSPEDVRNDFSPVTRVVLPEDLGRLVESIEYSAEHMTPWYCEYRVQVPGKPVSWLLGQSTPEKLADGSVIWHGFNTDVTDRKRVEEELRESEKKYSTLVESATDGVSIIQDQALKFANRRMSEMSGYTVEELTGMSTFDLVPPDFIPVLQERFRLRAEGKEVPEIFETRMLCKDGTAKEMESSTKLIRYQGRPAVIAITRDVTERKRMEKALQESEEKYSTLVENAIECVTINRDEDKRILYANKRMSEVSGYSIEELLGMTIIDLIPPDFFPVLRERFRMRMEGQEIPDILETRLLCKDGTIKELETSTRLIEYRGSPAVMSITRDFTERKRMEEALRQSEEKYRTLIQNIRDAIFIIKDAKIKYANEGFAKITDYSVDELIGKGIDELVAPEDLAVVADRYVRRMKGERVPSAYEFKLVKKDGVTRVDVIMDVGVITYEGGPAAMGIGKDITERKRIEDALRASEERYRLLADNASDVIMLMDMKAKPVYFSPSVTRMLGYSVEEALTGSMEGRMMPASMEKAVKHFMAGLHRERREPGGSTGQTLELEMIHKDGSIVIVEMMVSFIRDASGKPTGIMSIIRDITERKKAQEEIVQLSNAFKAARDPIIIFDMQGDVVNANEAAQQLFERDDVGANALETIAPEDRDRVAAVLQELMSTGQPAAAQFNIVTRSGRRVPVEASGSVIRGGDGKPVGIVVVERDLSERRQAEGRQKLAAEVLGILNEPMALPDAINRILTAIKRETGFYAVGIRLKKDEDFPYFVQNGFSNDFLLTENTLVARDNHGDVCRDKDGNVSLECTCGLVLSGKTDPSNPLFTPGGSAWTNDSPTLLDVPLEQDPRLHPRNRCIHAGFQSVALMPIRSGNDIVGLLQLNDRRKGCFTPEMIRFFEGIAASIGVALMRKQTEEALKESESLYRSILENMVDGYYRTDRSGKIILNSPSGAALLGYSSEDGIGRNAADFYYNSDDRKKFLDQLQKTGYVKDYELTLKQQDGTLIPVSASSRFYYNDKGEILGIEGIYRDIRERKQAEEALRESEKKMRALSENSPDVIMIIDREGRILFINRTVPEVTIEEVLGQCCYDYISQEYRQAYVEIVERIFCTGITDRAETHGLGPSGEMSWYETRFVSLQLEGENQTVMLIARDITERKLAEGALRESEERYRLLAENATDVIAIVGMDRRLTYISPSITRLLGYTVEEALSHMMEEIYTPESVARAVHIFTEELLTEQTGKGDPERTRTIELELYHKNGSVVPVEVNYRFLRDETGKPVAMLSMVRDITERRRAEAALRESEIKYRDLFEQTMLGTEVVDGETGKILLANHSMARIFGFKSPVDMVGIEAIRDHILPEDMDWVFDQFARALANPERREIATLRARKVDGRIIWVTGSATALMYEGKSAVLISLIDVTAAKEAEDKLRETEERIKSIVTTSQEWIWAIDPKGNHTFSNPAIENILGYRPDEIIGRDSLSLIHADDMAIAREVLSKCVTLKTGWSNLVLRWKHKDGSYRYLESNAVPILDSYGVISGFQGTDRDITDRKKAEEMLIRISKAVESSSDAIGMSDPQGRHFYHNKAFTELFEYTPEELHAAGDGPAAFANKHVARKVFDTITGGGSWIGEVEMVSKSGRKFTVLERADAIKDESGKVIGLVGVHTDITERKKAEEKLRETRDYMENLIEHANVPMVVWTPDFRITRFNRAFERLTGMKAKAVIGKDLEILFPKGSGERSMSFIRTAMRGARWEVVEIPIANVDGGVRTVLWNISPVYAEDGKTPMAIIAQGQDITERKKAEEALRESEELSRSMLDNAAMGIYLLQNRKFIYVNPTFEKIIGYGSEELVGQEPINYVHPDDRDIVRTKAVENIQGASVQPYEFRALRKDGRQIWVMERVTPVRYKGRRAVLASFMETTEHKKAEVELERAYEELKTAHERMVQSEKLRAMGEMASGIAHDFNNMLAVILGRTQLVIDDVKDDKVKKGIQIIEQAALDAAKTVKRLQDFARIRVEHPFEPLDVNEVVEGVLKMVESRRVELEQTKGIAIRVEQELGKTGRVSGDAAELREALLNILFNALDAMPSGGKLTVKSEQDEEWVQITIKDTGVGIPEKVKSKVFQPFFTTKASKGSGLGLSVTYGIISRHGGMIKFDSEVGTGTTFYIRLPLAVEEAKKQARKSKAATVKPASILTVDDEPEVLKALGLTLEYFGHWVKDFTSGAEAIKAFKDGKYDVVITDLGMPEVSGWDVARAIKKMKPDIPVLLITGWVIDLNEDQKKLVDGVIAKPFSRESISSAVSKVFPAKKKRVVKKKTAARKSAGKKKGSGKKKSTRQKKNE